MTLSTATLRTSGMLAAGMLGIGLLAGCAPTPEPTPTQTPLFASDEEAFAAAEKTYAEYTKAVNAADMSDPATFEAVYRWTTDDALASEKEALTLYHAEHLTMQGDGSFDTFEPVDASENEVIAQLCLDVSNVDLIRPDGESALPADREPRAGRKVTFVTGSSDTGLLIASNQAPEAGFTC